MITGKTVSDRDLSQQQPTLDEEFRDNRCLETTRWKVRPKIRRLERSEEQRIGGITVVSFPAPALGILLTAFLLYGLIVGHFPALGSIVRPLFSSPPFPLRGTKGMIEGPKEPSE